MDVIRESQPIARKNYICDAWYWYDNADIYEDLTDEEKMAADDCNGVIKKNERYIYAVQKIDGESNVFRANIAIDAICRKYNLYEE